MECSSMEFLQEERMVECSSMELEQWESLSACSLVAQCIDFNKFMSFLSENISRRGQINL